MNIYYLNNCIYFTLVGTFLSSYKKKFLFYVFKNAINIYSNIYRVCLQHLLCDIIVINIF